MKRRLIVLSGSGISAESGIPTFRGGDGMWDNVPIEEVCTSEAWRRNPETVLGFYNKLRSDLQKAQPNEAHTILKELEEYFDVNIITQNVDNLHERAGSSNVLHLHGELTKVRPEDCCNDYDGFSERYVLDVGYRAVKMGETGGPRNRQLRPHIVFFGESVPNLNEAARLTSTADIFLIIGTSLQVYPAASLYHYAPSNCPIYIIDPANAPAFLDKRFIHIQSVATEGMHRLRKTLLENER